MTKSDPTKNDLALGLNGMVLAVKDRPLKEVRATQVKIASVCMQLWPEDPVEATREILETLGLYVRTGMEATPAARTRGSKPRPRKR